jgi:hypothetical protein
LVFLRQAAAAAVLGPFLVNPAVQAVARVVVP